MSPSFLELLNELHALKARLSTVDKTDKWMDFFPCETVESLAAVEQATGFPVPPDLKDLLLTLGGLSVPIDIDGFTLTFHSRSPFPLPFGGLADLLDARWDWGGYRDPDDFPGEAIARLNANFVCFGHCEVDPNSADHFFYDRHGHFGVLRFDQEFRDHDAIDYLYELCSGENTRAPLTLEDVLTRPLKRAIWGEPEIDSE